MSDVMMGSSIAARAASWRDYYELLKPRVMTLVVFTAIAGMMAAPGTIHPAIAVAAILCVTIGAGAAGAINMWFERDIDAVMARTASRPTVQGRVEPAEALTFGVFLSVASVMTMALLVGWVAGALLALANLFYVFVYTIWLKRRTPQNIVIGGAAGAFPPMIGWAAVTGDVTLVPVLYFLLIFLWTPPHFWALALYRRPEYDKAGVPMLPVVAGERATKLQMLLYTLALVPVSLAPPLLGVGGWVTFGGGLVLGLLFVICAWRVWQEDGEATGHRAAKLMFGYSIFYLFALFGLIGVDGAAAGLGLS